MLPIGTTAEMGSHASDARCPRQDQEFVTSRLSGTPAGTKSLTQPRAADHWERVVNGSCRELVLSELLIDPLVRAVMTADGVDPRQFAAMLEDMARKLEARKAY